jgi:hypothetical protein
LGSAAPGRANPPSSECSVLTAELNLGRWTFAIVSGWAKQAGVGSCPIVSKFFWEIPSTSLCTLPESRCRPGADRHHETACLLRDCPGGLLESKSKNRLKLLTPACDSWDRATQAREAIAEHGLTYTDRFGAPPLKKRPALHLNDCARSWTFRKMPL